MADHSQKNTVLLVLSPTYARIVCGRKLNDKITIFT